MFSLEFLVDEVAHTMLLSSDGVPHPGRLVRLNRWRSRVITHSQALFRSLSE
jgi:hypothetical protein